LVLFGRQKKRKSVENARSKWTRKVPFSKWGKKGRVFERQEEEKKKRGDGILTGAGRGSFSTRHLGGFPF